MDCNVVVTHKGDTYDYFEDYAYYCEPDDIQSIKEAIDKAYNNSVNPKLKQKILDNYTWDKTAEATLKGYSMAIG